MTDAAAPATMVMTRFCCPECGGHRVEVLDWVTVNGGELIGGDLGEDYWCPDCETHPSRTEEREVHLTLCNSCAGHQWGTSVPIPGMRLGAGGAVQACELCDIFVDSRKAALCLAAEAARRGQRASVSYVVALAESHA